MIDLPAHSGRSDCSRPTVLTSIIVFVGRPEFAGFSSFTPDEPPFWLCVLSKQIARSRPRT